MLARDTTLPTAVVFFPHLLGIAHHLRVLIHIMQYTNVIEGFKWRCAGDVFACNNPGCSLRIAHIEIVHNP